MRGRRREGEACRPAHRPDRTFLSADEAKYGNITPNAGLSDDGSGSARLFRESRLQWWGRNKENMISGEVGGLRPARWRVKPFMAMWMLLAIAAAPPVSCQVGSGTFRFGEIYWQSQGNAVSFSIDVAFRRSQTSEWTFRGSAPDQLTAVGDEVLLAARETPQFFYGDSQMERVLRMKVTSISVQEDWVRGVVSLPPHTYSHPNNGGKPWMAEFVGCCRFTDLQNNAGSQWAITADIDLTRASRSPRSSSLAVVTVPYHPLQNPKPTFYVGVDELEQVQWALGKPAIVGGGVRIMSNVSGYLEVPLNPLFQSIPTVDCDVDSAAPACLFKALAGNFGVGGVTVEGWVRSVSSSGGYLVSTGVGSSCSLSLSSAAGVRRCAVSTMYIRVDEANVYVGHELPTATTPFFSTVEAAWALCSNVELCDKLKAYDVTMQGTLTNKWVHIAVVRTSTSNVACPDLSFSYTLYVNGIGLGMQGPFCGPAYGDGLMGSESSLLFGAYRPATSANRVYFDGSLAEWRFWYGVRSQNKIIGKMLSRIRQQDAEFRVDATQGDGSVTAATYASTAVLSALYDMTVECNGGDMACIVDMLAPIYPPAGGGLLTATGMNGGVLNTETDTSGVMFWESAADLTVGINPNGMVTMAPDGPGLYQVTVYISYAGGAGRVPVDLMVNAVHGMWDANIGAYVLCTDTSMPCSLQGNQYAPDVKFMADVIPKSDCNALYRGPTSATVPGMDLQQLLYPCSVSSYAGFDVRWMVVGTDMQQALLPARNGNLTMMPDYLNTQVGFIVGRKPDAMRLRMMSARTPSMMEVSWMPCTPGEAATVCIEAKDFHLNGSMMPVPSTSSATKCVHFTVLEDPPPFFDVAHSQVEPAVMTIGREGSFKVQAADENCADTLTVGLKNGERDLPGDAVLQPQRNFAVQTGRGCVGASRTLVWAPSYKHGGYKHMLCFEVMDAGGGCQQQVRHVAEHCVPVEVRRCVYAMQYDQQLQHVAGVYGTDWIKMWSVNMDILHPDYMPYVGQTIRIGHLYRLDSRREMAGDIARRMGMSVQQLQDLNFDMDASQPLRQGQMLCVVPDSCKGMARTLFGDLTYKNGKVLASGSDQMHVSEHDVQPRPPDNMWP